MNFWKKFRAGLFTKTQFMVGVSLTMLTTSALVYGYQLLDLHVFTPGSVVSSSEVNENFAQINDAISRSNNEFEVLVQGGVTLNTPITTTWTDYSSVAVESILYDDSEFGLASDFAATGRFTIQESAFYQFLAKAKINPAGTSAGAYGAVQVGTADGNTSIIYLGMDSNNTSFRSQEQTRFLEAGEVIEIRGYSEKYCCGSSSIEILSGSFTLKVKKL